MGRSFSLSYLTDALTYFNFLYTVMPTNIIILIAALIVALIIFRAVLKTLKTFISSAIAIFVILVILNMFGFSPDDLIQEITNLPEILRQMLTGEN